MNAQRPDQTRPTSLNQQTKKGLVLFLVWENGKNGMDFVMNQVLIVYIQQHAGSTPYLQVTAFLLGK